jgi:hypothetical protein
MGGITGGSYATAFGGNDDRYATAFGGGNDRWVDARDLR